jgi:peptidoglycan hydrolase-like protein with peptidoglycan-binding domain
MAQLGVDYANTDTINKPGVAGFTQAKDAGARIIIPRAVFGRPEYGQSPVYLDAYWSRDKNDIVAAGLNRSSYLFVCVPTKARPDTPDPDVQVAAFYGYVQLDKPTLGKKPHDMVPFFDVEMASDVLSADAYYDWILEVAKLMRSAFGAWPGMYTSERVWTEVLKDHAAGPLINCPLWIAKPWPWPEGSPVRLDGAPGYNPTTIPEFGDSTNWVLYQYAGDATGTPGFAPGATDTNRCNVIQRGAKGAIVKWIQARAGNLTVDGDFGPQTEARIKQLQGQYALAADGIVGIDTTVLLSWLNPAAG